MEDLQNQSITVKQNGMEYWKKVVILLCAGWTVLWIYRTVLNPILPEIKVELGIESDASMGLIASAFFLAYVSMQLPAGFLADKFGRKFVLIPGFLLFAIGTATVGLAPSLIFLLIGSAFAGLGQGTYFGSAYSISSEVIPAKKRGFSTAIINSGCAIGMGIGYIGSSFLVKDLGFSWRPLLFITTAIILILVICLAKILKERPQVKTAKSIVEDSNEEKVSLKTLLSDVRLVGAYALYFATCYGYYMIVTWLPSFLQMERGFKGAAIGFAASLVAFSAVPGALLFSRLSDKVQNKKILLIIILSIISAGTLYLTVAIHNNALMLLFLVMYGFFGKLAIDPILISYVADIAPKGSTSLTFGSINFFGMLSSVVAPFATGMISDVTGSKVLGFYLAIIIILIGTTVLFLTNLKKQPALN